MFHGTTENTPCAMNNVVGCEWEVFGLNNSVTGAVTGITSGNIILSQTTLDIHVAVTGTTGSGAPATGAGVYWSCDDGNSYVEDDSGIAASDKPLLWKVYADPSTYTTQPARTCPTNMASITTYAGTIYAALLGGGSVYKTTNGGATWALSNTGLPTGVEVFSLAIDCGAGGGAGSPTCANPQLLYAATSAGVYKSTNGGASWAIDGLQGSVVNAVITEAEHATAAIRRRRPTGRRRPKHGHVHARRCLQLPDQRGRHHHHLQRGCRLQRHVHGHERRLADPVHRDVADGRVSGRWRRFGRPIQSARVRRDQPGRRTVSSQRAVERLMATSSRHLVILAASTLGLVACSQGPFGGKPTPDAPVDGAPDAAVGSADPLAALAALPPMCSDAGWCWNEPTPGPGGLAYQKIVASDPNNVWLTAGGPPYAVVLQWDGTSWTRRYPTVPTGDPDVPGDPGPVHEWPERCLDCLRRLGRPLGRLGLDDHR